MQKNKLIRVSPSLLESYRLFMSEDWFTVEKMDDAIVGEFVPNRPIRLGQAYHHMLEHWRKYKGKGVVVIDGFALDFDGCMFPNFDLMNDSAVFEVYGKKNLDTSYGLVSVASKADCLMGNQLIEVKTTEKYYSYEKYADSAQWKLCAWVFGFERVNYRVQKLKDQGGYIECIQFDDIPLVFSPSLESDIVDLIHGLIGYHYERGLEWWLQPYQERKDQTPPDVSHLFNDKEKDDD